MEHDEKKRAEAAEAVKRMKLLYDNLLQGRVPETATLATAITRMELLLQLEETKNRDLDDRGRQVARDLRNLLESSKKILEEKNANDKIQYFLYHSVRAAQELSQQMRPVSGAESAAISEATQKGRADMQKTLYHGRKVVMLLARSPAFRNSITTLLDVARTLLASTESRQAIMQSMQGGIPRAVAAAKKEFVEEEVVEEEEEQESEEFLEEEEEPEEVIQEYQQSYSVYPSRIVPRETSERVGITTAGIAGAAAAAGQARQAAMVSSSKMPQEAVSSSGGKMEITKQFEEKIDPETRRKLQQNLFRVLDELSENEDHRNAIESLFRLMTLAGSSVWAVGSSRLTADESATNLRMAIDDGKQVIEHFIGEGRLDPLFLHIRNLSVAFKDDPEVTLLFRKVRNYFTAALRQPGLLKEPQFRQKSSKYFDSAVAIGHRYKDQEDLNFVLNESRSILETIRTDTTLTEFTTALEQLMNDMTVRDQAGKRHYDPIVMAQIKNMALPLLIEQLHYIPIPPQVGNTPAYSYSLDDIVVSAYDILPEHIFVDTTSHTDIKPLSEAQHRQIDETLEGGRHFETHGDVKEHHKHGIFTGRRKVPPRESIAPAATTWKDRNMTAPIGAVQAVDSHMRTAAVLVIRAYSIHLNLKNLHFHFKRLKMPRIQDDGRIDVSTKGRSGCSVVIRLDLASDTAPNQLFTGGSVHVHVPRLAIRFHDVKHSFLLPTLGKLFSGAIRKRVQATMTERLNVVTKNIVDALNDYVRRSPGVAAKLSGAAKGQAFNFKKVVMSVASKAMEAAKQQAPAAAMGVAQQQ